MIRNVVALVALVFILFTVNAAIYKKEQHLETGRVVFLELAPVDPRSLMQGDYMALRFAAANQLRAALPKLDKNRDHWWRRVDAEDGWAVFNVDERGVGEFFAIANSPKSSSDQINLAFRIRTGSLKFATNAFFFQEGTGELYEQARFGEFRVNAKGEPLLVGLRDENLVKLEMSVAPTE